MAKPHRSTVPAAARTRPVWAPANLTWTPATGDLGALGKFFGPSGRGSSAPAVCAPRPAAPAPSAALVLA